MRAPDPGAKLAELVSRPLVKVCGLTRQDDVDAAVEAGADLVGFILAQESPRRTEELLDAPETVLRVAVFVGDPTRPTPTSSSSTSARTATARAMRPSCARASASAPSSTSRGRKSDPQHLERARSTPGRVMLAGGLGADNVARRSRRSGPGRSTPRARRS